MERKWHKRAERDRAKRIQAATTDEAERARREREGAAALQKQMEERAYDRMIEEERTIMEGQRMLAQIKAMEEEEKRKEEQRKIEAAKRREELVKANADVRAVALRRRRRHSAVTPPARTTPRSSLVASARRDRR